MILKIFKYKNTDTTYQSVEWVGDIPLSDLIDRYAYDQYGKCKEEGTFLELLKRLGYVYSITGRWLIIDTTNTKIFFNNHVFKEDFLDNIKEIIKPFWREELINELI